MAHPPRQILSHCVIYLLALWTKETGVMLAPLYAAFGSFYLGRGWRELRRNAALYMAMAVTFGIYLAMRPVALGGFAPRRVAFFHLSAAEFALSVVVTAAQYLRTLLLPFDLNYFHVFHPAHVITIRFAISLTALVCVTALTLRSRTPLLSYGIFWMAASIAPALNLTALGQNVFTERYLYLPSVGFCWIAAWAWSLVAERNSGWAKPAGAAVLLICAMLVIARNRDWRDNFTLLRITERQSPDSGWVHDALAAEYVERGAFDRALEEERLAVRYDPRHGAVSQETGLHPIGQRQPRRDCGIPTGEPVGARRCCQPLRSCNGIRSRGGLKKPAEEYKRALELQPQCREAKQGYERVEERLR